MSEPDKNKSGSALEQARECIKSERFTEAFSLLEKQVTQNPGDEQAWEELSSVLLSLDDDVRTEQVFFRARELSAGGNRFWYTMAQAMHGPSAQECYRLALKFNPEDEQSLLELAWNLRTSGDKD